jgi:hypothetical protein
MANNSYCKVIRNFDPAAVIPFNENVQNRAVGQMLGDLSTQVRQMPLKLQ